ncbi:nickel-binding protein [Maribacter sp. ACAM166]|uniref:nickel-binding protein n=1 Tax=Maribacter sp. ACAM166 TaxID=2508996 RepID=UPI0010FF3C9B|nr:nickel-binding protein [Maribacter sp. ACAM166]TLP79156.1 DUF4242 domain-containing protein [Maribacter sp. ACAM166]
MPIYMDRHDVSEGVTAEDVAALHNEDLLIQHKFCCKGLSYWFDENRNTAFCLVEAPNKEAIIEMHAKAHGEVPNSIIEVDTSIVESFLGRIEDPAKSQKKELNIINNPAFRVLAVLKFIEDGQTILPTDAHLTQIKTTIENFDGRLIDSHNNHLLISFTSTTKALDATLVLKKLFSASKIDAKQIRIGISAGVPVTKQHGFFEETIKTAMRLTIMHQQQIIITTEVKELYESENRNHKLNTEEFITLPFQEEQFLNDLMNYLENEWQNPDLGVDDFCSHLGLSTSQLYRKTKGLLQTSTNNLIQKYRLDKAFKLLLKKEINISEIAFETGFNSAAYFTKCFQKKYGFSPSSLAKHT